MVASLLKPLSTGIQDERIFYKMTFFPFIKVWNSTGRFTTQLVRLDFDIAPTFGSTAHVRLVRKGQLITRLFLVAEMPEIFAPQAAAIASAGADFVGPRFGWTNSLGHALISKATMDIGNSRIDTIDTRLLEMLDEYTIPIEKTTTMNRLIKRLDNGFTQTSFGNSPQRTQVIVPLPFWFCRGDPACAFPIDAILQDDIRVNITFRPVDGLYYTDSRNPSTAAAVSDAEGSALWPISESRFYKKDAGGSVVPGLYPPGQVVIPIEGIRMPRTFPLGECYVLAEYVYLDQPEANRFRLSDLQIPIVQHYAMNPYQTRGLPRGIIPVDCPNPTRDMFWMANRVEAPRYNAYFLATRDLSGTTGIAPWWPNATGLSANMPGFLRPAFSLSDSEPFSGFALMYEGSLVRFRTQTPALFRSIIPSWEQKKSPWVNRFYYNYSFGMWPGYTDFSRPRGEANLEKVSKREFVFELTPYRDSFNPNDVPSYVVYMWCETYNVLRVYGGRAGLLFSH